MKKRNWRLFAVSLSLIALLAAALLPSCATSGAKGFDGDYAGFEPGVTVLEDPASPTGYTAVFIFEEPDMSYYDTYTDDNGHYGLAGSRITKVEFFSDTMMLFTYEEQEYAAGLNADFMHAPDEFRIGMYPAGGYPENAYIAEMENYADGLWGLSVPLSSGAFGYYFRVYDDAGNFVVKVDDPNNPSMKNTATGHHSRFSMVYIPYNPERMGTGEYADRSVELPRADNIKGTLDMISYPSPNSTDGSGSRGLAVYLPYGYSSTGEPYNVLYLSHGQQTEEQGNELRWMNEIAVPNIMDNLLAEGAMAPFIVVSMNNKDLGWDYELIWEEQARIMEEIERRYNVVASPEGRAYGGLSMGALTASNLLLNHPDAFSYYGIFSYGATSFGDVTLASLIESGRLNGKKILLASGYWDHLTPHVDAIKDVFDEYGFEDYDYLLVPTGHDWEAWQLIYAYAAKNFFWR